MTTEFHNVLNRFIRRYLSSKQIAQGIIKNKTLLLGWMMILTLLAIIPASRLKIDASGVSFTMADSQDYKTYQEFVTSFGTDDYILLVVQTSLEISDPELKKRIKTAHEELGAMPSIFKVIDLETLASSGLFNLLGARNYQDKKQLATLRQTIPGLDRLISHDLKHLGFIVKIDNETLNGFRLEKQLEQMKEIITKWFPEHPHCYAAGIAVLRSAFERYNLENAIIFGALGLLFGILVAFYLFKTLWAVLLVLVISVTSLIWTLGIMGISNIDLNLASGLSFGFILVISTTTVFHIVTAYFQALKIQTEDKALAKTFQTVMRPCFMCALTTSTGFSSLMISPVPMIRQAGIIISIGVMLTFFLTLLITAVSLPKLLSRPSQKKGGVPDRGITHHLAAGFKKPGGAVLTGIVFMVIMGTGIPGIQRVKHLTTPFIKSSPEAKDLEFIEQHLSTGTSFSVTLKSADHTFNNRDFWYKLVQFEKDINALPGVAGVESLTRLVFSLALKFSPAGIKPEAAFDQIRNKDVVRSYFDPVSNTLRLIVHIQSRTSDQIEEILSRVNDQADRIFSKTARVKISGQLILLRAQTTDIVASQIKTLLLALFIISTLMILQLKSFVLGILSLIPNLFPLITIFGIMGWFHIPLDPLTIFAAIISFGLSVDDSIHYLTQLKREMSNPETRGNIRGCLETAYQKTAPALVSTTAVLFLSALGLLFSSFTHVFSLGILISSASITALIGDLVFLPAVILRFRPLTLLLSPKIKSPL